MPTNLILEGLLYCLFLGRLSFIHSTFARIKKKEKNTGLSRTSCLCVTSSFEDVKIKLNKRNVAKSTANTNVFKFIVSTCF